MITPRVLQGLRALVVALLLVLAPGDTIAGIAAVAGWPKGPSSGNS